MTEQKQQINFRFPSALLAQIKQLSSQEDKTHTQWIIDACKEKIERDTNSDSNSNSDSDNDSTITTQCTQQAESTTQQELDQLKAEINSLKATLKNQQDDLSIHWDKLTRHDGKLKQHDKLEREVHRLQDTYPDVMATLKEQKVSIKEINDQLTSLKISKVDRQQFTKHQDYTDYLKSVFDGLSCNLPSQIEPQATETKQEEVNHQESENLPSTAKITESMNIEQKLEILADDDRWLNQLTNFEAKRAKPFIEKLLIDAGIESEGFTISANDVSAFYKDRFKSSPLTTAQQKALTRAKGEGAKGKDAKSFNAYKLFSLAVEKVKDKNEYN